MSAPPGGRHHAPFFFVTSAALDAEPLRIEGADARHLAVVRRALPGDVVALSDGQGRAVEARLISVTPERVEAIAEADSAIPQPRPVLCVYQGLAKGDKLDAVIRQLVELGVERVVIFPAGRSAARWDPARAAAAAARWAAVAHEAAKQSHRRWLPELSGPLCLRDAAAHAHARGGLGLLALPGAGLTLAEALEAPAQHGPQRIWIVVGPEGGLEPAEVEAFTGAGAVAVTLGSQILRTETAALAVAAAVMYRFGRFGR